MKFLALGNVLCPRSGIRQVTGRLRSRCICAELPLVLPMGALRHFQLLFPIERSGMINGPPGYNFCRAN